MPTGSGTLAVPSRLLGRLADGRAEGGLRGPSLSARGCGVGPSPFGEDAQGQTPLKRMARRTLPTARTKAATRRGKPIRVERS